MACAHLTDLTAAEPATPDGCAECLETGGRWIHLRLCMSCGHVGCCDSSPGKHATAHVADTDDQVVQSFEPGEDWAFCYADEDVLTSVEPDLRRSYA